MRYASIPLRTWIENFPLFPNFELTLLIDKGGNYVGHISRESLIALMIQRQSHGYEPERDEHQKTLDKIISLINENDISEFKKQPFLVSHRILEETPNIKALKFMNEFNMNFVVVVDSQNKVKGILEKDKIIEKMLLSLKGK